MHPRGTPVLRHRQENLVTLRRPTKKGLDFWRKLRCKIAQVLGPKLRPKTMPATGPLPSCDTRQGFNSGPQFWGQNWTPRFSPHFGFKNAPASENVSHLPRDKFRFSVDRSHFASCMSPMVTSAKSSHNSLRPLQNQRERLNQKRNSNWGGTSMRRQVWPRFSTPKVDPCKSGFGHPRNAVLLVVYTLLSTRSGLQLGWILFGF